MAELIRLRDLPGMRRILELSLNPHQHDPNMRTQLDEEADAVSIKLFGITKWDTYFDIYDDSVEDEDEDEDEDVDDTDPVLTDDEWQRLDQYLTSVSLCDQPFENSQAFWEAIGWDVSDGSGSEMLSADLFLRQILAVEAAIIEGAKFHPDANGKPLFDWHGNPMAKSMSFEEKLQAEAERFLIGRTG